MTRWLLVTVCLTAVGCGQDTTSTTAGDPGNLYWRLTLNHHAVTLSTVPPYDTIQLVATPRTVDGAPLAGGTDLRFTVLEGDTTVLVNPAGLVTGHAPAHEVRVIASMTVDGVTRSDSVVVNVNPITTPPTLQTLSIHPVVGGALSGDCNTSAPPALPLQLLDTRNVTIPDAVVAFTSADSTLVAVDFLTGVVMPKCPAGRLFTPVMLYASTTVYGVTMRDSVPFTVTAPLLSYVFIKASPQPTDTVAAFFPSEIVIGVGGIVGWLNQFGRDSVDMIFDDLGAARATTENTIFLFGGFVIPPSESGGSVAPFKADTTISLFEAPFFVTNTRVRQFPRAGVYPYHNTRDGTTGRVVVRQSP